MAIFTNSEPGASFVEHAEAWRTDVAAVAEHGDRAVVLGVARQVTGGLIEWALLLDELTAIVGALSADQVSDARCRAGLTDISDRLVS